MIFKQTKLKNGINLVFSGLNESNTTTIIVLIKTGSANELIPGLAHFVEHIVFKGSKKRQTARKINYEIEKMGAYMNASTSQEYTEYYIKFPNKFLKNAFEIISDIIINPLLSEKDIEQEKNIVIEELKMYDDTPVRSVADNFYSLVWDNDLLGSPVLGIEDSVKLIKKSDIEYYLNTYYIPENITISVVGNQEYDKVLESFSKNWEEYKVSNYKKNQKNIFKLNLQNSVFEDDRIKVQVIKKNVSQFHFCIGVEALNSKDENLPNLEVGAGILAEGSGSLLWQKIREELSASYYLNSEIDTFNSKGLWYIHSGIDSEKFSTVIKEIFNGFNKIIKKNISVKDIYRTKEYLKGDLLMTLEGSEEIARYLCYELAEHGKIKSLIEEQALIDKANIDDISLLLNNLLKKKIYVNILSSEITLHDAKNTINEALSKSLIY